MGLCPGLGPNFVPGFRSGSGYTDKMAIQLGQIDKGAKRYKKDDQYTTNMTN